MCTAYYILFTGTKCKYINLFVFFFERCFYDNAFAVRLLIFLILVDFFL